MSRPETAARAGPASQPQAGQRTDRMAAWSLVLSIVWLGGLGSLAGIALGIAARRRIAETGGRGTGLAVAGIVIGVLTLIFAVAYWVFLAVHMGGGGYGHSGGGSGGGGGY